MAGDDGIAPPLKGSEPSVPLLYESPIVKRAERFCRCLVIYSLISIHWGVEDVHHQSSCTDP